MIWFFLLTGCLLGWSLGANDASNVFGTAVGSRMVSFRNAAIIASIGVILGAVISGAGAADTLGSLGAVNAMAGSFTVALAAGATVAWVSRLAIPVSLSQTVVGAIIGWNLFTGSPTDLAILRKIVVSWAISPVLAAIVAVALYFLARKLLSESRIHLFELDAYTRLGLIIVGFFGAYSLGANNIAIVMGVFVPVSPFTTIEIANRFTFSSIQQLFLLGGLSIALGIFTYSYRVMTTVGRDLFRLTPILALIVVLSHSIVLFVFASEGLQSFLTGIGLPSFPLVPVSSTQAVIGAIVGLAIVKGGSGFDYQVLGRITVGWVTTPIAAGILSFILLFFMQNVFQLEVVLPLP